jgi:hypothetical protein
MAACLAPRSASLKSKKASSLGVQKWKSGTCAFILEH